MPENETENLDSTNEADKTENEIDLDLSDDESEAEGENVDELKKQISTLKAQKDHWKKKATTSEKKPEAKPETEVNKGGSNENTLTPQEALVLAKADVDVDDVDTVIKYAKFSGITVSEALKDTTLRGILSDRVEKRKTALATNTGPSRRASLPTPEAIIEKHRRGEGKEDEIDRLTEARMEGKLKKN